MRLYAQLAIEAARGGDDLYTGSLMTLAEGVTGPQRARLERARDGALKALHEYAGWLAAGRSDAGLEADGRRPVQLPAPPARARSPSTRTTSRQLGEVELARYRALEALLKDPSLASPDPARAARVPKDQAEFLSAYEARQKEMMSSLGRTVS